MVKNKASRAKGYVLIWLAISAFISGCLYQFYRQSELIIYGYLTYALIAIAAILVFIWYHLDTEEIGFKRNFFLNISVIVVGFIGLPIYFFLSRGVKSGLFYTAIFIALVIAWTIIQEAGMLLVSYAV